MNRVSSIGVALAVLWLLILSTGLRAQSGALAKTEAGATRDLSDPQKLFEAGEAALHAGKLDEAEHEFRQVLAINPEVAGAYANLGVIYMRRKQWRQALEMLHKAEKLAPDMVGIQLNIGLIYYRQNFRAAIEPFESVVQSEIRPGEQDTFSAFRYFFNGRWAKIQSQRLNRSGSRCRHPGPPQLSLRAGPGCGDLEKCGTRREKPTRGWPRLGRDSPEYRMGIIWGRV